MFHVIAQKNDHSGFSYQSHFSVQEYDTVFGNVISDPFRYLEDADNPKTKEFIRSQKEFLELQ